MAIRAARGSISRPTLIWIVVAAFLIASGIGVYFAIRKGSKSAAPAGAPINLEAPPPPPPSSNANALPQSEDGRAQFVDRNDPNRLAGEMLYRRLDPLPRGRYALNEPQLWLFMKDGRTLHLQATKGNVKFFTGTQKPESGRFEGGVVARMYSKGVATPAERPDPRVVAPEMIAYTNSVSFDLSVGEFSTDEVVNLSTPDTELQGEGLNLVYNEIRERVESIEIGAIAYLHARGSRTAATTHAPSTPAPQPAPNGTAPATVNAPPAAAAPRIDLYAVNIAGPVALTVGTESPQSISADRLLVWARLIDGKLPPDAIAELKSKTKPEASATPSTPVTPPAATPAPPSPAPANIAAIPGLRERIQKLRVMGPGGIEPLTPISDDDALLTWGGRLVGVAVEQAPAELEKEHFAGRFVSESSEPVVLMDSRTGATVLCNAAHYGATTAGASLVGKDNEPITIADARGGHGELPALTLNLKSGIGQSRGPGFLNRRDPNKKGDAKEPAQERLAWSDQADFVFSTGSAGAGIQSLREASFTGDVKGITNGAEVSGDFLKAWFAPSTARDSIMSRVTIDGNSAGKTTDAAEAQSLHAAKFELAFKPNEKGTESFPSRLVATGAVRGERTELVPDEQDKNVRVPRQSKLESESLDATLAHDEKGNTVVTDAVARGNASFERSDGVSARGEQIDAVVTNKTADITGEKATVSARGATLAAAGLHLDGAKNAVIAKGAGRLDHTDPDAAKLAPGQRAALPAEQLGVTTLTWTKGMRFDDSTGEGEAVGESVAVTHPDPFTQNTVRGERLFIRTVPAASRPKTEAAKDATTPEADPLTDLKLISAEAIAPESSGDGAPPKATAEQRRYVTDEAAPGGRRLEKLTYIEGARLVADEQNGTFTVPAAGRALVLDHSVAKEEKPTASSSPFASVGAQGTTLMEWSGTMTMNRLTELAEAGGGVRITHKPLNESERPVILESDSVQARFKLADKSRDAVVTNQPGDDKQRDQLVSVTARGGVRVVSDLGNKELTADEATYNAVDSIVEASAINPNNGVTFVDKTKAIPTIARKLRWNLKTDAIDIIEPMPVVVPGK